MSTALVNVFLNALVSVRRHVQFLAKPGKNGALEAMAQLMRRRNFNVPLPPTPQQTSMINEPSENHDAPATQNTLEKQHSRLLHTIAKVGPTLFVLLVMGGGWLAVHEINTGGQSEEEVATVERSGDAGYVDVARRQNQCGEVRDRSCTGSDLSPTSTRFPVAFGTTTPSTSM